MHFVCDFDETLFDTNTLWNKWLDFLENTGINRDEAIAKVESVIIEGFTPEKHALRLGLHEKDVHHLAKQFRQYTEQHAPSLVFSDVIPFFEQYKLVHSFSLLTYGDSSYQREKVSAAQIDPFFTSLRIAGPHKHKVRHLEELLSHENEPIVFVDDSPNELNPVVNAGLPVKLYRIVRPGAKHDYIHERDNVAWTRISTLKEIGS